MQKKNYEKNLVIHINFFLLKTFFCLQNFSFSKNKIQKLFLATSPVITKLNFERFRRIFFLSKRKDEFEEEKLMKYMSKNGYFQNILHIIIIILDVKLKYLYLLKTSIEEL